MESVYDMTSYTDEILGLWVDYHDAGFPSLNSLWPSDIWWHGSGSTLFQVNACCLMAPGLRKNQCCLNHQLGPLHYSNVMMSMMASQITGLTSVYSTVCLGADQRKQQRSASRAFVGGIHRWPMTSPHKWPVIRKMFPFDGVIMGI